MLNKIKMLNMTFIKLNYNNSKNQSDSLMEKVEIKIIFGIIMVSLCLITTIGNLIVIYKYKKSYSVGACFIKI
jgi:hypothetical protein